MYARHKHISSSHGNMLLHLSYERNMMRSDFLTVYLFWRMIVVIANPRDDIWNRALCPYWCHLMMQVLLSFTMKNVNCEVASEKVGSKTKDWHRKITTLKFVIKRRFLRVVCMP